MFAKKVILAAAVVGGLAVAGAAGADDSESKTLLKNSYQQQVEAFCSPTANGCRLLFPPMTDEKTVITAVSCSVAVTAGSVVGFNLAILGTNQSAHLPSFIFDQDTFNGPWQAATNATTNLYFNNGAQAAMIVSVSNGGQFTTTLPLSCTISGYHS
jgi:hypothetical protein